MSVPHPNWPIRVGGEYETSGDTKMYRRVTELDGDIVHSLRFHADGTPANPNEADRMKMNRFRVSYRPEDQSPIPALVAALKACMEKGRTTATLEQGNAALALAGETSGEEANAADKL